MQGCIGDLKNISIVHFFSLIIILPNKYTELIINLKRVGYKMPKKYFLIVSGRKQVFYPNIRIYIVTYDL